MLHYYVISSEIESEWKPSTLEIDGLIPCEPWKIAWEFLFNLKTKKMSLQIFILHRCSDTQVTHWPCKHLIAKIGTRTSYNWIHLMCDQTNAHMHDCACIFMCQLTRRYNFFASLLIASVLLWTTHNLIIFCCWCCCCMAKWLARFVPHLSSDTQCQATTASWKISNGEEEKYRMNVLHLIIIFCHISLSHWLQSMSQTIWAIHFSQNLLFCCCCCSSCGLDFVCNKTLL